MVIQMFTAGIAGCSRSPLPASVMPAHDNMPPDCVLLCRLMQYLAHLHPVTDSMVVATGTYLAHSTLVYPG